MPAVHAGDLVRFLGATVGEDWIPGYKPAFNFQMTLVDAVARWLALNPAWLGRQAGVRPASDLREAAQIWIGPPPTMSKPPPPPQELEQMLHIAQKFDVAGRDERNRALGRTGEERVLAHERAARRSVGRDDLARKVRWVSDVGLRMGQTARAAMARAREVGVTTPSGAMRSARSAFRMTATSIASWISAPCTGVR